MQGIEQPEHLEGRGAVEISRWLIGEHDDRLVRKRPGDRHPLALTARERGRQMLGAFGEANLFEQLAGASPGLPERASGEEYRQLDVFLRRQFVHQVVRLENEADIAPPQLGERTFTQLIDASAVQPELAARWPIKPTQ